MLCCSNHYSSSQYEKFLSRVIAVSAVTLLVVGILGHFDVIQGLMPAANWSMVGTGGAAILGCIKRCITLYRQSMEEEEAVRQVEEFEQQARRGEHLTDVKLPENAAENPIQKSIEEEEAVRQVKEFGQQARRREHLTDVKLPENAAENPIQKIISYLIEMGFTNVSVIVNQGVMVYVNVKSDQQCFSIEVPRNSQTRNSQNRLDERIIEEIERHIDSTIRVLAISCFLSKHIDLPITVQNVKNGLIEIAGPYLNYTFMLPNRLPPPKLIEQIVSASLDERLVEGYRGENNTGMKIFCTCVLKPRVEQFLRLLGFSKPVLTFLDFEKHRFGYTLQLDEGRDIPLTYISFFENQNITNKLVFKEIFYSIFNYSLSVTPLPLY